MDKNNRRQDKGGLRLRREGGMTLLEVAFAISILLIGVTFIARGDSAKYRYQVRYEIKEQMFFYAAGQLERLLQNPDIELEDLQGSGSGADYPIKGFKVVVFGPKKINEHLVSIGVTVSAPNVANPPEPVTLYTYRVN